jgi:DHA1 family bicyclomycin/chloramphenicol resistance-like MFS transporter
MIVAFGYLVGNFGTARLSARLGVNTVIGVGIAIMWFGMALWFALMFALPQAGPWALFLPQFFLSVGSGFLLPNGIAGAVSVRPQAAGTASGLTGFMQQGLGAIMAQLLGSLITGATSAMPVAITVLGLCIAIAIVYLAWVRPRDLKA